MKEDKEIEKILLNDEKYEKFINQKTEKEFMEILAEGINSKITETKDISKVPRNKLFSKDTTYIVINKDSRTKSFINGMQAESFIADKNILREKLISGLTDSFVSGNCYVKFYKSKV